MVDRAYPKGSRPEVTTHHQGSGKDLTHGRIRFLGLLCWEISIVPWGRIGVKWDTSSGVHCVNLLIDIMDYQIPCGRPGMNICQCLSSSQLKNPFH